MKKLDQLIQKSRELDSQIAPALAEVVVDAIKKNSEKDLLIAIGTIAGESISAEHLLIAIREHLKEK